SSKDDKYVARLQKVWGGNQYWSEIGSNGAGWYVLTEGNRVLPVRTGVTTVEHIGPAPETPASEATTTGGGEESDPFLGQPPCPPCHGVYSVPLPRASGGGDDPVAKLAGMGLLLVAAMLGDDSGSGPHADARRAVVAAFDENPNHEAGDAQSLPTRICPTCDT